MTTQITREAWLKVIQSSIEQVGDCIEWTGPYLRTTPLVYCPRGYAWEGQAQCRQSLRPVLFALKHGRRLPAGHILRTKCENWRCVNAEHFIRLTRKTQSAEQASRGEFSTARALVAKVRSARARAQITEEIAQAIRTSGRSSAEEAKAYNISTGTVTSIRRGKAWAPALQGASVFTWGGGAS